MKVFISNRILHVLAYSGHNQILAVFLLYEISASTRGLCILYRASLSRGPKLLSMYTVEQRGFLVRKYWQTGSFKACQTEFRTEFGERRAPSKSWIQKLVKKLETRGSRSNSCRLLSLGPTKGQSVQKYAPHNQHNSKTLYAKRFKPSTSTLWEKYSRIWRNAFKCVWMWK